MHEEIIISGFGGQGALFAGQVLAYAGMAEGRHVTWIPSYGPEMRGGTARCTVIISDDEIGSPLVRRPTAAIVMNIPSMEKYEPLVQEGGVLVYNTSLIDRLAQRKDIRSVAVPATDIAVELGNPRLANMVMLGVFLALTRVVSPSTVEQVLDEHLADRWRHLLEPNKEALRRGMALALEELVPGEPLPALGHSSARHFPPPEPSTRF